MDILHPKKQDVFEEIHGITVADPYRWLENPEDPEVKEWIQKNNEQVDSALRTNANQIFSEELAKNYKALTFSNPFPAKGRYFYSERQPHEDQFALYVKNGLDGAPIKLFDPNGQRAGNTMTISRWFESRTGTFVAYGISEGGDEMATWCIKNVDTLEELPEKIRNCSNLSLRWLPDDLGFFYTRTARPGTVPKNEERLHQKVYFHKLGDNPDADELIFGADRPKDDMVGISLSLDGRYLAIDVARNWTENEIYIYDRETGETKPLIVKIPALFSISFLNDKVILHTNYKANNYRVLWSSIADMYRSVDEWEELIPERESLLISARPTKSKILAEYLVNACSEVVVFDYDGRETEKIPLPKYSSLAGISCRRDEEEFFYGVESLLFPKIVYRYDPSTSKYTEFRKMDNVINPEDYQVNQEWCESKDGTKIPMFIFHKKGLVLDGKNSTILYGYGGFNNSQTPVFLKNWIPWTEKGGVFVLGVIRGGGEFGKQWHESATKERKQNSFDDFIAISEHLISKKYTSSQHLGILGGSNGGLLVTAVGVQRPDLFKAISPKVPLTDMVRFHKFGMGLRWIHEYGNPDTKEDLQHILKWSPYHNVMEGTRYPSFFFATAEKDGRVDPLHTRKMAALVQGAHEKNKVLVFTEMDAGHGPGKPVAKFVESQALTLSFFAQELGLPIRATINK